MNPTAVAVQAGLRRGGIELRQTLTSYQDLWGYFFWPVVFLAVMFFLRGVDVPGTNFSISTLSIPSIVGMQIAFVGLTNVAAVLLTEREDGTLLRAKATPNGMLGYLIGKIVQIAGVSLISVAIILIPGALLFDGLQLGSPVAWLALVALLIFGLLATAPIGAVIGSLVSDPRSMGLVFIPLMGLIATSGIFYPITNFPFWLQWIAQIFPVYWLGLGMRSALLPDSFVSVEIGESWRHLEMVGVLGIWAVIGLVLAPVLLRRMARRESGSSVDERREKAMSRSGW